MKYILMTYVNESAWPKMTKAEQEQGAAAYATRRGWGATPAGGLGWSELTIFISFQS